jgi:hypothetical protein
VLSLVEKHDVLFGTDLHKALTKYWLFNNWMSVVASRAFSLDSSLTKHCGKEITNEYSRVLAMMPLFDLINHKIPT